MATYCYECGEPLSHKEKMAGHTLCAKCLYEEEEFWRRWRKEPPRCWGCGQVIEGGKYCYWCGKRKGFW